MNSQPGFAARHVAIIGAGPAGLLAAERLAEAGFGVTVYDRMPSVGRKFLMAGRGGLNLTHSEALPDLIARYGRAAAWIAPLIEAFPPEALRQWCHGLGQETFIGSSKRVFPVGLKASPLLRAWLRRLDGLGVRFALRHQWRGWRGGDMLFTDAAGQDVVVQADAVLLALGGASWPRLGSDGGWVGILRAQGVEVAGLRPANGGFMAGWSELFSERFAGQPLKPVVASFGGAHLQGEAMITRQGLEGGVIYALSAALRDAIEREGEAVLRFDLRPGLSVETLAARLAAPRGSQSLSNFLRKVSGLSPAALALLRESVAGAVLPEGAQALAALIKETRIRLTATMPIARAISSAGGIGRDQCDEHLMLKAKPGVFAAGEMLDWEAPTGGYLLQGCFSTGFAAANGIKAYLAG